MMIALKIKKTLKASVIGCLLFGSGLATLPAYGEEYLLNFRDADIRALIDDVSMMTGRTFILDPRVRGNVTIISQDPVDETAVFDLFLSALRVYGFTVVPTNSGAYKVVPDEAAIQDGSLSTAPPAGDDQLISEIFRIDHVDPLTVLNTVKPLVNRQGRAIAHRTQNFILLVDFAGNMRRLRSIIENIDQDNSVTRIVGLDNVDAEEMADTLRSLRGRVGDDGSDVSFSAIPVRSSNSLILKGDASVLDGMEKLTKDLDARGAARGNIKVVYLKHATAEEIAPVLEKVTRSLNSASTGAEQSAGSATIDFHAPTNSLIISASPDMQQALADVVRQLDIPRAQVLVEAIIVEVSDNAARELGFQYVLSGSEGSNVPFTATNFSQSAPNILAATGALAAPDGTFNNAINAGLAQSAVDGLLGLSGFVGGIGGESNGTLFGVIFNALQTDLQSNILSTPYVMTMDNQPASLISGQEIPVTTGEQLGTAQLNAFRTVERIEVGIKLTVTPHINDDGQIRLQINQEVSSVFGNVGQTADLITNKRAVDTTVMVNDGEIVILGGLLEENEQISLEKVPVLGDIPLLGELFKSRGTSRAKTNLMVFLRPTVVRDPDDSLGVTNRKLNVAREGSLPRRDGSTSIDYILQDFMGGKATPATTPATSNPDGGR